jgi:hypothetical protein
MKNTDLDACSCLCAFCVITAVAGAAKMVFCVTNATGNAKNHSLHSWAQLP